MADLDFSVTATPRESAIVRDTSYFWYLGYVDRGVEGLADRNSGTVVYWNWIAGEVPECLIHPPGEERTKT